MADAVAPALLILLPPPSPLFRLKKVLKCHIPDPSAFFSQLSSEHGGDFQVGVWGWRAEAGSWCGPAGVRAVAPTGGRRSWDSGFALSRQMLQGTASGGRGPFPQLTPPFSG